MHDDDRRLHAAVALGIISAEQAEAIRALAPARSHGAPSGTESPRAFNPSTLAYFLGATTVLVAMGWFLSDRWSWLGPWGVLAVAVMYAALFLAVANRLRTVGFPHAAGFATLLAVLMVPVVGTAILRLTGWFAESSRSLCYDPDYSFWGCRGEEVLLELATASAALIALRRVRFSLLVVPLIAIGVRGIFVAGDSTWHGLYDGTAGWTWMLGASLLCAVAYHVDRVQRGDEDFALWIHLGAAVSGFTASAMLVASYGNFRHLLVPAAFVAFAFSLRMRRAAWLTLGFVWFVWYLAWLADDVFGDTPFFPVVLAALGLMLIVATVWAQRNRDRLLARFGAVDGDAVAPDGRAALRFPGGIGLMLLPAVIALYHLPAAAELGRALRADAQAGSRAYQAISQRRERETIPPPRP